MSKAPRTVARIKSTGAFGDFPGVVLAAVEHDTYILESEAATALAEAQAHIARLEAALREARDAAHSFAHDGYDGVWNEDDFAQLTPLADAALAQGKGDGV